MKQFRELLGSTGQAPGASNDNAGLRGKLAVPLRSANRTLLGTLAVAGAFLVAVPISGAVIATGSISPAGQTRTVEAPSPGRLANLGITEGDLVAAGSTVVTISNALSQASFNAAQSSLIEVMAQEIRLRAERLGSEAPDFSPVEDRFGNAPDLLAIVAAERERFQSNRTAIRTRLALLRQSVAQQEDQIEGLARQIISLEGQARITTEEERMLTPLFERGLVRATRIYDLQRRLSAFGGQIGLLNARIAEVREAIGASQLELAAVQDERARELDGELAQAQSRRFQLEQELAIQTDAVERAIIRAPVTGQVSNLRDVTEGAVIAQGDPLFDLVPTEEALVIEAAIRPQDIDLVTVGQEAMIALSALPQRSTPRLEGSVRSISPDTYTDPATSAPFFRVLVEIADDASIVDDLNLVTGMPADVFLRTEDRTLLTYLLEPLLFAVGRTFRET